MTKGKGRGTRDGMPRKETGAGFGDDMAEAINMRDGILVRGTEETGGDILAGDLVLVAHAAKGGEGIVDQGNMVEDKSGGQPLHCLREAEIRERPSAAVGAGRRGDGVGKRRRRRGTRRRRRRRRRRRT